MICDESKLMLGHLSSTMQSAEPLLGGDAGTSQTIDKIRELVNDAWRNLDVRRFAIDILRDAGAPQYDDWAKIRAIYDWVTAHFYFVLDPVSKEVLMPFPDLVELGAGDCDEINATAMAVLFGVIGYEPRLVTVAADSNSPEGFSHVYAEVLLNGNWVPMDAARPGAQIGKAPESFYRRAWWSLTEDFCADYPGPGQLDGLRATATRRRARLNGYAATMGTLGDDYIDPLTGELISSETPGSLQEAQANQAIAEFYATPASYGGGGIDWTKILQSTLQLVPQVLNTVNVATGGPSSALRPAIGPGGSYSVAPASGSALISNPFSGMSPTTLLLLLGGGLFLAMAMGGKRR